MSSFHFGRESRGIAALFKTASSRKAARRELPRLTDEVPGDSLLDSTHAHEDDAPASTGFEVTAPGELATLSFGRSRFF